MDNVNGAVVDERPESFLKTKEALAGCDGCRSRFGQVAVGAPVLRSVTTRAQMAHLNHVLGPGQIVRFERARVADTVIEAQCSEMVGGQRCFPADLVAHSLDILTQVLQS